MRRRILLFSTISTITLALAIFCFGVWASMSQTLLVSNTIGFNSANEIYVSISGNILNSRQTSLTEIPQGYDSLKEYYLDKNLAYEKIFTEQDRTDGNTRINNWVVGQDLQFVESENGITFQIEFKNYSEKAITVEITDYVENNANIQNYASSKITLDGYLYNENPDSGIITLNTKPKSNREFNEMNNFTITISTVEND